MFLRASLLIGLFIASLAPGYESYQEACDAGLQAYRQRDWQGALLAFGQAAELAANPADRCNSHLLLGHAYRQTGDYRLAREAYARVVATEGASEAFVYHACQAAAQCAVQQGDFAAAEQLYLDLIKLQALSPTKQACIYGRLAELYTRQQNPDAADRAYRQALAVPGLPSVTLADSLLRYGNYLYTCNRFEEARAQYLQVVAIEDISSESRCLARHRLGLTWYAEKDYPRAADAFSRIAEHDAAPERLAAEALLYLGLCHLQLQQPELARAELEKLPTVKGAARWHLDTARAQLERLDRLAEAISSTANAAP